MPGTLNFSKIDNTQESTLNNSQGQIKMSNRGGDERGFSISNIKNSLFSKISNIFNKDEQQQL